MNPDDVARIIAKHTRMALGRCRGCVLPHREARPVAWLRACLTAPSWRACNARKVALDARTRIVHPGGPAGAALTAWRNL